MDRTFFEAMEGLFLQISVTESQLDVKFFALDEQKTNSFAFEQNFSHMPRHRGSKLGLESTVSFLTCAVALRPISQILLSQSFMDPRPTVQIAVYVSPRLGCRPDLGFTEHGTQRAEAD